jgi:L-malate glycosyltransferase
MKLLLLAPLDSTHTYKWVEALAGRNIEICVVGIHSVSNPHLYAMLPNVTVRSLGVNSNATTQRTGDVSKIRYLARLSHVKSAIRSFQPDIVHAHFASSNGLLASLANFHPFIVSVWGSDIFEFPYVSPLHRAVMRFNLNRADRVLSTSVIMARQTTEFTDKTVEVTPFGVDIHRFRPQLKPARVGLVIGTVKALEPKYGVDCLLHAFKLLVDRKPEASLTLLLVGEGSQRKDLEALASELQIENKVVFTGRVPHREIARYHNMMDISVFTPICTESFGVAAVEASACGNPVVAANIGGLPEIVDHGVTGYVVPPRSPARTADAIEKLLGDRGLRVRMGFAGRRRVQRLFNWNDNVNRMIDIYRSTLGHAGTPSDHDLTTA